MRFQAAQLFGRAFESARRVLRDLDADQVPARLRKVAAHSGALTPPLADRLLRELDQLDWLREKCLEAWPEAEADADGPDRASALLLLRPDGWGIDLSRIAWDLASEAGATRAASEDRAAGDLERELGATRDRLKALQRERDALHSELAEAKRKQRAPERSKRAQEAREAEEAGRRADAEAARADAAEADAKELRARIAEAGEEIKRLRRERAGLEAQIAEARPKGEWVDRTPLDLARHLDRVMEQASRAVSGATGGEAAEARLALPAGVRPDAADAIDAVLRLDPPLRLIVDGYNAGLALGPGEPAEVRSRLEGHVRRLSTLAGGGTTVSVVWDSSFEGPTVRRGDRLDVRFAPAGTPADDVVVELAGASDRVVVITNDRELRERSEERGALALWSDALVAWVARRT